MHDLNGATLLRFIRGYASGAGLEYDVAMINQALCERHALHIIQIHMARPGEPLDRNEIRLGKGKVTNIPLLRDVLPVASPEGAPGFLGSLAQRCKHSFRDNILFNPLTGPSYSTWAARRRPRSRPGDVDGVGTMVSEVIKSSRIDLLVCHAAGGSDAWEAIHAARLAKVPTAIQLHFANSRFLDHSVRIQMAMVDGVGGVSDVNVPRYLADRFTNLLTAVDQQFFCKAAARPFNREFKRPVLVLPARIVPTKGQEDLVKAVGMLRDWGITVDVVLAGRADQPDYERALRDQIKRAGLSDVFHFPGLLSQAETRDLYAVSDVLTFPTYHQEGLPRILLEAQAMEVPVVVYDSGGSRAGLRHGESGILVPTGDVPEFARSIRRILQDQDLARAYTRAGRKLIETHFGLHALADRHEQFISKTILNTGSRTNEP